MARCAALNCRAQAPAGQRFCRRHLTMLPADLARDVSAPKPTNAALLKAARVIADAEGRHFVTEGRDG